MTKKLLILLVFLLLPVSVFAWPAGYAYRTSFVFGNANGAGSGYPVTVVVGETSGATGEDFDIGGNSQEWPTLTDGGDFLFTDNDGETALAFDVIDISGTTPNRAFTIRVKYTDSLESSSQTAYLYYGNSSATNYEDPDNTYIFYEDFSTIDFTNVWQSTDESKYTTDGDIATFADLATSTQYIETQSLEMAQSTTFCFEFLYKIVNNNDNSYFYLNSGVQGGGSFATGRIVHFYNNSGVFTHSYMNTSDAWQSYTSTAISTDGTSWWKWEYYKYGNNSGYFKLYDDGVLQYTSGNYTDVKDTALHFLGFGWKGGMDVDYMLARKYVNPEPAFSSAGAEESAPTSSGQVMFTTIN